MTDFFTLLIRFLQIQLIYLGTSKIQECYVVSQGSEK